MEDYIVSIGTICIDDIITSSIWPQLGDKTLAKSKGYIVGGMPYNTACVLSNMGVKTYMLDVIGNDYKDLIIDDLKENNVDYSLCNYDNHKTLRTIIVNVNGERVIFVINDFDKPDIILNDKKKELLLNAKYVYTNIPEIKRIKDNKNFIKFLLNNNVKIVYDIESTMINSVHRDEFYFENASILSFNEKGFKKFINNKHYNYINKYLNKGITIIVTKGKNGCEVFTKNVHEKIGGHKVKPVDTTGAGDTFNAVFLAKQIIGNDTIVSIKEANRIAALSTEYFGVNKFIGKVLNK